MRVSLVKMQAAMVATESVSTEFALTFHQLNVVDSSGTPLLQNIAGYVRHDGMTAILGESGSGKSLLMETLSGRHDRSLHVTGHMTVNKTYVDLNRRNRDAAIGFVSQEDSLIGDLTVREIVDFSAKLGAQSLQSDRTAVKSTVDSVIEGFHLTDVQHNVVGTVLKRYEWSQPHRCQHVNK